jgi:hypothetical protein
MIKFLLHLLFLSLLCVGLSRCKHEPVIDPNGPQCGEATTIEEMLEWVYFKTGTYWIYEEQNTGVLDTMTVYYDYNGVSSSGYREFVVKMESSLDGYTYEYWFNDAWSGDCDLLPSCFCRVIDCGKYIPGNVAGANHVFIFPLKIGNQCSQSGGGINFGPSIIAEHIISDTIAGVVYSNVYKIEQTYSPQHEYEASIYKLSDGVGIIQKMIPSFSENWHLIEYQIIQ